MSRSIKEEHNLGILIHNVGTMVSGDIENPILQEEAVYIKGKYIEQVGAYKELKKNKVDLDIDIQGMTLCPGLIDTHVHPNIGDWAPRTRTMGWMELSAHAGVTSMVSQGEVLLPGRPHDAAGVKALALLARRVYEVYRPGGVKAHCGALLLEEGLTEKDIKELHDQGIWLFAEIGLGGLRDAEKVNELVKAARKYGYKIPMHFGPESVPGTQGGLTIDDMIEINPDVIVHFNGGSTSCPFPVMKKLAENCPAFLELITDGSYKAMRQGIELLRERNEFNRIILGTDGPGGPACEFAGIIRLVARISCLFDIPAATVMAMGTGNAAKAYGLNTGMIKPGREADLIVIDAPLGSQGSNAMEAMEAGDRPNMGMVMIDGTVIVRMQARLFPATKRVLINGQEDPTKYPDIQFD